MVRQDSAPGGGYERSERERSRSAWKATDIIAAVGGTVAPWVFLLVVFALGAATAHYDPATQTASELAIGRLGWIMRLNLCGLGTLLLVAALRLRHNGCWRWRRVLTLLGVVGAAFFIAGICVIDPGARLESVHGAVHLAAAATVFACITAAACLVLRFRLRFRFTRPVARATAWVTPLLMLSTQFFREDGGILQRVLLTLDFLFVTVIFVEMSHTAGPDPVDPRIDSRQPS